MSLALSWSFVAWFERVVNFDGSRQNCSKLWHWPSLALLCSKRIYVCLFFFTFSWVCARGIQYLLIHSFCVSGFEKEKNDSTSQLDFQKSWAHSFTILVVGGDFLVLYLHGTDCRAVEWTVSALGVGL